MLNYSSGEELEDQSAPEHVLVLEEAPDEIEAPVLFEFALG